MDNYNNNNIFTAIVLTLCLLGVLLVVLFLDVLLSMGISYVLSCVGILIERKVLFVAIFVLQFIMCIVAFVKTQIDKEEN